MVWAYSHQPATLLFLLLKELFFETRETIAFQTNLLVGAVESGAFVGEDTDNPTSLQ
jgi:hypothetical protein